MVQHQQVMCRIKHVWYDGPQLALDFLVDGEWVPYGYTQWVPEVYAWAEGVEDDQQWIDPAPWPEGEYEWNNGPVLEGR